MRPRNSTGIDGESLQADVMRFMAIIAFCLVAIMALVRDVAPPGSPQVAVAEAEPEPLKPKPAPVLPKPVREEPPATRPLVAKAEPEPDVEPIAEAAPVPVPIPAPVSEPIAERVIEPVVEVVTEAVAKEAVAQEAIVEAVVEPAPAPEAEEEGLTLRFHSDRDFLRLIGKGDVAVYLFQPNSTLKLSRDYAFSETRAPGALYELMPETIPAAVASAARAAVVDVAAYRWGVQMPGRIERRIRSLVATERSGQLVINRFGEVRHLGGNAASRGAVRGG